MFKFCESGAGMIHAVFVLLACYMLCLYCSLQVPGEPDQDDDAGRADILRPRADLPEKLSHHL